MLENKDTFRSAVIIFLLASRQLTQDRDSFRKMMESVTKPFPECVDYLVENIKLDPYFNEYFQWALKNEIPTVILSSGMEPIIRAILKNLVGLDHDKLDIVSNEVEARPGMAIDQEGGWQIKYHDDRYDEVNSFRIEFMY